MGITRKEVVFDLDTTNEGLRSHYPNRDNWRKAYSDIRQFMEGNGFEHRQGSAYISIKPFTNDQVLDLVEKLRDTMDWLPKCINALDIANVGIKISYLDEIKNIPNKENRPELVKQTERNLEYEMKEAINKCDYPKLMQLHGEGYTPSAVAIKSIMEDKNISNNTKIAVSKIFGLEENKGKNPLSDIKLATSGIIKGKDKTLEL